MTDKIRPPWTPEQVSALNRFQQYAGMHPFTCGNEHDGPSLILMAHRDGWHCSDSACGYRQNWAHAFMATPDAWPQSPIRSYPDALREQAETDTAGLTRDEETEAGETWEQQDDGLWTLPIEGGTLLFTQRRSPEDRARFAAAWKQAERTVPRFTARPVTPEIEAAATTRAVQAAADSEKTAAWFKETGGVLGAPAATEATGGSCSAGAPETEPNTITDPAWLREQYAAALRRAFDDQIIAEWICCEPINPGHKLCKNGETARKMVAGLLSDSDQDAYPSRILDALMTVRDRHLQQLRQRLELADADLDRYEEHVVGDLNEANIGLARQAARAEAERDQLADDLRYALDDHGPRHTHKQPGTWDDTGAPCAHCTRLEQARQHLTNLTPTEA